MDPVSIISLGLGVSTGGQLLGKRGYKRRDKRRGLQNSIPLHIINSHWYRGKFPLKIKKIPYLFPRGRPLPNGASKFETNPRPRRRIGFFEKKWKKGLETKPPAWEELSGVGRGKAKGF